MDVRSTSRSLGKTCGKAVDDPEEGVFPSAEMDPVSLETSSEFLRSQVHVAAHRAHLPLRIQTLESVSCRLTMLPSRISIGPSASPAASSSNSLNLLRRSSCSETPVSGCSGHADMCREPTSRQLAHTFRRKLHGKDVQNPLLVDSQAEAGRSIRLRCRTGLDSGATPVELPRLKTARPATRRSHPEAHWSSAVVHCNPVWQYPCIRAARLDGFRKSLTPNPGRGLIVDRCPERALRDAHDPQPHGGGAAVAQAREKHQSLGN